MATILNGNTILNAVTGLEIPGPVVQADFTTLTAATSPSWIDVTGMTDANSANRTLYDSTGNLTYAPSNLIPQSNNFSTGQTVAGITISGSQTDPNGGSTASAFVEDGTTGLHREFPSSISYYIPVFNGVTYIYSVYVKPSTRTWFAIALTGSISSTSRVYFNLSGSGSVGTTSGIATGGISLSTNGYYRVWVKFTANAAGTVAPYLECADADNSNSYAGSNGSTAVFVAFKLAESVTYQASPSTYIATTTAIYYGPRYGYNPSPLAANGLLIEESRVNLALYSNDFSSSWSVPNGALAQGSGINPTGVNTITSLTRGANTSQEAMGRFGSSQSVSTTYTLSVYAKQNTSGALLYLRNLAVDNGTANGVVTFALDGSNTVTAGSTYTGKTSITSVGNGWYRCSIFGTTTSTIATNLIDVGCSTNAGLVSGSAGASIYIFGAQLEAGSFATSYIPTVDASVTRAPDIIALSGAPLTTMQSSTGSAIVQTFALTGPINLQAIIGDSSGQGYSPIQSVAASLPRSYTPAGAFNGGTFTGSYVTGQVRTGLAWDAGARSLSANNNTPVSSLGGVPTSVAPVYLGRASSVYMTGWIQSAAFYGGRLPDPFLQKKTTVGAPY